MRGVAVSAGALSLVIAAAPLLGAQPPDQPQAEGSTADQPASDPWTRVRYLVGDWAGEGSGRPGEGSGTFSFRFDLGGSVLVRRDHSEYPPAGGRPAVVHDGLMVIYPRARGDGLAAVYFDNEGHVIHYDVGASPGGGTVVFLGEPAAGAPRYRLSYERLGADEVTVSFEIAPPGTPLVFKPYLAGRSRRVGR